jgi:16S rRNA (guanine966-N2)-methyltransferase
MRIVAGLHKGRRLRGPVTAGVRPTSDKLRETLFNIVSTDGPDFRVLDAFAGTGAVGLEAISRGASHATFIESDRRACGVIAANVDLCRAGDRCIIERGSFAAVAARLTGRHHFDLVFLDPPYDLPDMAAVVDVAVDLTAPGGLIVLEHARRRGAPDAARATVTRTVTSGDSELTFYVPAANDD